jgi:hypothetical protein
MNIVDAIILISRSKKYFLCDDEEERSGVRSICVYGRTPDIPEFVGKIRWPKNNQPGTLDFPEEVIQELELLRTDDMYD